MGDQDHGLEDRGREFAAWKSVAVVRARRVDAVDVVPPRRRRHAAPAQVNAKRCLGNAWVARNDIPRAIRRYGAAIEIGDSDYDITDEDEKRKLREAVAACKLNRAMCHLKLKHYADCDKDCDEPCGNQKFTARSIDATPARHRF